MNITLPYTEWQGLLQELDALTATIAQKDAEIERLRGALKEIAKASSEYTLKEDGAETPNNYWEWEDNGTEILVKIDDIVEKALEVNYD